MTPAPSLIIRDRDLMKEEPGMDTADGIGENRVESRVQRAGETANHTVDACDPRSGSAPRANDGQQEEDSVLELDLRVIVLVECGLHVEARKLCLAVRSPESFQRLRTYCHSRAELSKCELARDLYMEGVDLCTLALQLRPLKLQESDTGEPWSSLNVCREGLIEAVTRLDTIAGRQERMAGEQAHPSVHKKRQLRAPWTPPVDDEGR